MPYGDSNPSTKENFRVSKSFGQSEQVIMKN